MVQYDYDVVAAACEKYLVDGHDVGTITTIVYGPTITETVIPTSCSLSGETYQKDDPEPYEEHGDDYASEDSYESHSPDDSPAPQYDFEDGNDYAETAEDYDHEVSDDGEEGPPNFSFEDGNDYEPGSDY